ncbi:MAG: hypothetical protein ACI81A_000454, partial [Paraglaciecola sp.]
LIYKKSLPREQKVHSDALPFSMLLTQHSAIKQG